MAVLSLAVGIGANTAIFSLVNAIILRDTPIERPEELVNIYLDQAAFQYSSLSYPDFEDLRDGTNDVFSGIAAAQFVPVQVDSETGSGGVRVELAEAVTGSYFSLLGIEAELGRMLLPSDDISPGGHPVIVLDHGYWQSGFGADPDVIGRDLRVGGREYTIVGVAPADFEGSLRGIAPKFYASIMMADELFGSEVLDARGSHSLFGNARLRPGVTLPQAEASVASVATSLTQARLDGWDPTAQFVLVPSTDVLLYPPMDSYIRASAWLLMVVVGLVLLLACTDLASFLLARAIDARKEIAIRLALGRDPAGARAPPVD